MLFNPFYRRNLFLLCRSRYAYPSVISDFLLLSSNSRKEKLINPFCFFNIERFKHDVYVRAVVCSICYFQNSSLSLFSNKNNFSSIVIPLSDPVDAGQLCEIKCRCGDPAGV